MKPLTGARIGQSHGELTAAIVFSTFFHAVIIAAALLIAYSVREHISVPPFYSVKLVNLPADLRQLQPVMSPEPATPQPTPAPKKPSEETIRVTKPKTAPPKPKAATPKDALPELKADTKKKAAPDAETATAAVRPQESVSVAAAGGEKEFPFLPYVAIVRDKMERNWNPPPGVKGMVVKVTFTIMRSGRVGEVKLVSPSGQFYFDQAAMRAVLASSPFPPLPEGFFRDYETFSVDLVERD
jgi:TonB family protein